MHLKGFLSLPKCSLPYYKNFCLKVFGFKKELSLMTSQQSAYAILLNVDRMAYIFWKSLLHLLLNETKRNKNNILITNEDIRWSKFYKGTNKMTRSTNVNIIGKCWKICLSWKVFIWKKNMLNYGLLTSLSNVKYMRIEKKKIKKQINKFCPSLLFDHYSNLCEFWEKVKIKVSAR